MLGNREARAIALRKGRPSRTLIGGVVAALVVVVLVAGCEVLDRRDSSRDPISGLVGRPDTSSPTPAPTSTASATETATREIGPAAQTPGESVVDHVTPSTSLAYFHTISERGDSPVEVAKQAGIVILTYGDEPYRDALREAGYSGTILLYLNAAHVHGPGPYADASAECDETFVPLRNGIVRGVGDFCRDLHANEDWFLHNGEGDRLYSLVSGTEVHYHMDPANPEWRAYASQRVVEQLIGPQSSGYDGILLDNVDLSMTRLTDLAANADGEVQEYPSEEDYRRAWRDYLALIRARGGDAAVIWATFASDPNRGSYWSEYLPFIDGVLSPAFATGYRPLTVAGWENNLAQAEKALRGGVDLIAVSRGEQDDLEWQQFALATYLLIVEPDKSWFRYVHPESNDALLTLWQYPNYEIALGAPLGPRTESGATWRREFACGYVEVNPALQTGTIVQTECTSGTGS